MRAIKTGHMPEKITAHAMALSSMVKHLSANSVIRGNLSSKALRVMLQSFEEYADAQAMMDPNSLHHVYEWGRVGDPNSRLFKGNITKGTLTFSFLPSRTTSPTSSEAFVNKAFVMERGEPIIISPKNSRVLAFEVNGEMIFTPNPVMVSNPGGPNVAGSFERMYRGWIRSNLPMLALIENNFFKSISKATMTEVTRTINPYARKAKNTAFASSVGKKAAVAIERAVKV